MRRVGWVLLLSLTVLTGCARDRATGPTGRLSQLRPFGPFAEAALSIEHPDGTTLCACVLEADTPAERSRGLMRVTDLEGYDGMLFVYREDVETRYHMRDTPRRLSIAWFTAAGAVVSVQDMAPCGDTGDCPRYDAGAPYRFALEVFAGDFERLGVTSEATITRVDDCPGRSV